MIDEIGWLVGRDGARVSLAELLRKRQGVGRTILVDGRDDGSLDELLEGVTPDLEIVLVEPTVGGRRSWSRATATALGLSTEEPAVERGASLAPWTFPAAKAALVEAQARSALAAAPVEGAAEAVVGPDENGGGARPTNSEHAASTQTGARSSDSERGASTETGARPSDSERGASTETGARPSDGELAAPPEDGVEERGDAIDLGASTAVRRLQGHRSSRAARIWRSVAARRA